MDDDLERKLLAMPSMEAKKVILELGDKRDHTAVPLLIKLLSETDDWRVQKASALALGDIGDPEAVAPIMAVLKDPKALSKFDCTGMLSALQSFDVSDYLDDLVEFVFDRRIVPRSEAGMAIEASFSRADPEVARRVFSRIRAELKALDDQAGFLAEVLDTLVTLRNDLSDLAGDDADDNDLDDDSPDG